MSVGAQVDQAQINGRLHDLSLRLHTLMRDARDFQQFITQVAGGAAGLEADYGFTPDDAYLIDISAGDLLLLANLVENAATLPTAKDFYAFLSSSWGLGG